MYVYNTNNTTTRYLMQASITNERQILQFKALEQTRSARRPSFEKYKNAKKLAIYGALPMVTSVYLPAKDVQITPITVSEGCDGFALLVLCVRLAIHWSNRTGDVASVPPESSKTPRRQ